MLREAIALVAQGDDLTEIQAQQAMETIMRGEATPAQIGAFITGLRIKGETIDEITGCALAMRAHARHIRPKVQRLVDTCGTGGDGSNTFNVSTAAAFVIAGADVSVAKHGNRSVSSKCGSADVLEALGVTVDLDAPQVEACIEEVGIGFLFAPRFHASMRHAAGPRREIGIRTIFNLLGPLTNPAGAKGQVVGVYHPDLTEPLAHVLGRLGVEHALVVHGMDKLDEISIGAPTRVSRLYKGEVETFTIKPESVGMKPASLADIQGGDAQENADILRNLLKGEQGPRRDILLLNAAAGLVVAGQADTIADGVTIAAEVIDSGKALEKVEALVEFTQGAAA